MIWCKKLQGGLQLRAASLPKNRFSELPKLAVGLAYLFMMVMLPDFRPSVAVMLGDVPWGVAPLGGQGGR